MFDPLTWLNANNGSVVAIATVVLAGFAAIQLAQERSRKNDARAAARSSLSAQVRVVRRSLDSLFRVSYNEESARRLSDLLLPNLEHLQSEFLESLRLAGASSKRDAEAVTQAFEQFLSFGDHLRLVQSVAVTVKDSQGFAVDYDEDARGLINVYARSALTSLRSAANELAALAPRPDHEQGLLESKVPLLVSGKAIRTVVPNRSSGAA